MVWARASERRPKALLRRLRMTCSEPARPAEEGRRRAWNSCESELVAAVRSLNRPHSTELSSCA